MHDTLNQTADDGGKVLLRNISWGVYETLLHEIGDSAVHLTYDNGFLEIEEPSRRHERIKKLIDAMIRVVLEGNDTDYEPVGSATWKRDEKLKGIEADECYFIQNAQLIRDTKDDSAELAPPPDLAVEVDVSVSSIDKFQVYAAIGVGELWRVSDPPNVEYYLLRSDGSYAPATTSHAVPQLKPATVSEYIRLFDEVGFTEAIRQFKKRMGQFKSE